MQVNAALTVRVVALQTAGTPWGRISATAYPGPQPRRWRGAVFAGRAMALLTTGPHIIIVPPMNGSFSICGIRPEIIG
jgi:hypothetical protein